MEQLFWCEQRGYRVTWPIPIWDESQTFWWWSTTWICLENAPKKCHIFPIDSPVMGDFPFGICPKSATKPRTKNWFFPAPELSWVSHFLDPNHVLGPWSPMVHQCIPAVEPCPTCYHPAPSPVLRGPNWAPERRVESQKPQAVRTRWLCNSIMWETHKVTICMGAISTIPYIHGDMIEEYRGYTHPLVWYSWSGPSGWFLSQSLFVSRALLGCYPSC